jgi:hypothetical protein
MALQLTENDCRMVLALMKQIDNVNTRLLAQELYKKPNEDLTQSNIVSARSRYRNFESKLNKWETDNNKDTGKVGKATLKKGEDVSAAGQEETETPQKKRSRDDGDGGASSGAVKKVKKTSGKGHKTLVKQEALNGDADADADTDADTDADANVDMAEDAAMNEFIDFEGGL